jgi:hypothetical protein
MPPSGRLGAASLNGGDAGQRVKPRKIGVKQVCPRQQVRGYSVVYQPVA